MSEKFIKLFEKASKIRNEAEDELWLHLSKCVGRTYKFVNNDGIVFYIEVIYFRGFDRIGVNHVCEEFNESIQDEWDVEEFYEIIKDAVEVN